MKAEGLRIAFSYAICAAIVGISLFRASIYAVGFAPFTRMATWWVLIGLALIALLTVSVIKKGRPLIRVRANAPMLAIYLAFAALAIISTLMHRVYVGMRPNIFASLLLIGFCCIWLRHGVYTLVVTRIARTLLVIYTCYAIVSLIRVHPASWQLFHIQSLERYAGLNTNPNGLGALMAGAIVCGVFIIISDTARWRICSLCLSVFCMMTLLLTGSRTALLAASVAVAFGIIFGVRRSFRKRGVNRNAVIGVTALISVAFVAVFIVVLVRMRGGVSVAEGQTGWFAFLDIVSSGRAGLWLDTFEKLAIWGTDPIAEPIAYNGAILRDAHNVPLTYAYNFGIFAGLSYLIFEISAFAFAFARAFSRKRTTSTCLFPLLSTSLFFVYSMLEVYADWIRFPYSLLFTIGLAPVFFSRKRGGQGKR